jgi:hypothetical protein
VAEGLQLVVPGLAEELVDLVEERGVAERGLDHRGLEAVLRDHDVAVQAGHRVVDAQLRGEREAGALAGGGRLLGDLEAQVVPAAQRRGDGRGGAGRPAPRQLGAVGAGLGGLRSPVEAHGHAEDSTHRPLDVGAQGRGS